jgi:hypothetical protein
VHTLLAALGTTFCAVAVLAHLVEKLGNSTQLVQLQTFACFIAFIALLFRS